MSPDSKTRPDEPSAETPADPTDGCDLRLAVVDEAVHCDGDTCVYWRVLGHVGVEMPAERGCALRYFDVLGAERPQLAHWLLSVKRRVEETEAADRARG